MTTQTELKLAIVAGDSATEDSSSTYRDDRVNQAVAEFLKAAEQSGPVDINRLIAKYSDIADELRACVDTFDFMRNIAPQLKEDTNHALSEESPTISPLATLGDFRIVREIGRGGMGVVYEALQLSLGRSMALKVLPFAGMLDKQQLKRFKNEARAAATLDHPNVVAVHSVGEDRGVHYYAMQLVEGQSLAEVIAGLRANHGMRLSEQGDRTIAFAKRRSAPPPTKATDEQPKADVAAPSRSADTQPDVQAAISTLPTFDTREYFRAVARLGIQAAEALDHAHQNGILHRDIKPGNLLVDAEGKLSVTDFGLARVENEAGMTMTGDLLGTLAYMSPEQALAKRVVVDHRTDIYSLGVTLYELLTLRAAYAGCDRQELLKKIAFDEPRRPRDINPRIPRDLETIVRKAIEKSPDDRYAAAQDLAKDLCNFINDEPIKAKPPSLPVSVNKWARRHMGAVWTATCAALLLAVISVIAAGLLARSRSETRRQAVVAETEKQEALRNLYRANVQIAHHEWSQGRVDLALRHLDDVRPQHGEDDLRHWEWFHVRSLCRHGETSDAYAVHTAIDSPLRLIQRIDGDTHTFVDQGTGDVKLVVVDNGILKVKLSPTGERLVARSHSRNDISVRSGDIRVFELASRKMLWRKEVTPGVISVDWSPAGDRFVTGHSKDRINVWDAENGKVLVKMQDSKGFGWVFDIAWNPKRQLIAASGEGGDAAIWNSTSGELVRRWTVFRNERFSSGVSSIAWDPSGRLVATGGQDLVHIWDLNSDEPTVRIEAHRGHVGAIAWSPDGEELATGGSSDGLVRIWISSSGKLENTFRGHTGSIRSLQWSNRGKQLASESVGQQKGWQPDEQQSHLLMPGRGAITWTPAAKLVTCRRREKSSQLLVVDVPSTKIVTTLETNSNGGVSCLSVGPADQRLATGHSDGTLRLWNLRTGTVQQAIEVYSEELRCVSWSPDGSRIATSGGSHEDGFRIFDSHSGEEVCRLRIKDDRDTPHGSVSWSPNGKMFVGVKTRDIKVWRTDDWEEVHYFKTSDGGDAIAYGVAWNPTGDRFASATGELLNVWDLKTGQRALRFRAHYGYGIASLSWSPDGTRFATGGDDHLIKIWNASTGEDMLTLEGHENQVAYIAWSPDGRKLASSDATKVLVWDASRGYSH